MRIARGRGGFGLIIAATVVAGIAGYLVTLVVYRELGAATYAVFAVFWAALYLVIGGLSGIQQEITRATRPIIPGTQDRASRARNFAAVVATGVFIIVAASSPLWQDAVFPGIGWPLVIPLAVGAASYVAVAVLSGSLYGVSRWGALASLIAVDGILRLALVAVGLAFTRDPVVLAWLVAAPFPLAILLVWPVIRSSFVHTTDLDVGYRGLSWNSFRTVFASVSTAVLVSGFPLLLGVTSMAESAALLGEVIFTITLARAPLIVSVMSLQSYFVVKFRDQPNAGSRLLATVIGVIAAGAIVLAAVGWWLGPAVFGWVSGRPTALDGMFIAIVVGSSAVVGILSVVGAGLLARSQHYGYSTSWAVAAVATVTVMVLPLDLIPRVELALLLGPSAGLLVCGVWLLIGRADTRSETLVTE